MDVYLCAFLIKDFKKKKFADLREFILGRHSVSVKTFKDFTWKITSFSIAVP